MALIDVPYDEANPVCQKLADHLENPDGSMKIEGVNFYYMPLEEAMKYVEQDVAGYWGNESERDNSSKVCSQFLDKKIL